MITFIFYYLGEAYYQLVKEIFDLYFTGMSGRYVNTRK